MQTAWESISFSVPLSTVGSFALRNNMSINVYGVDDDNEVIYPLVRRDMLFEHGSV